MENSVKAMYMVGGILIGVLVISSFVYIFTTGISLQRNYETDRNTEGIQAFNAKFERYLNVTRGTVGSFDTIGNLPSDVITCANLAYNINMKNRGPKGEFDIQSGVEVVVRIGSTNYYVNCCAQQPKDYFIKGKNRQQSSLLDVNLTKKQLDSKPEVYFSFNNFMEQYSKVQIGADAKLLYQYYFDVDKDENGNENRGLEYSEITGRVNKIVFTMTSANF